VLDLRDGRADGVPALPDRAARAHWLQVMDAEWQAFCRRVDAQQDTLLDPYGAEAIDEFFAVASEAFFVAPVEMRREHPPLYELLRSFYRQNPADPLGRS
jgi:MtfA peptidase